MTHILKTSIFLLALLLTVTADAYDFEVDGIYYNINGTQATVTSSPLNNQYKGDVTIPASVVYSGTTYSVTSISNSAFSGCSGLTGVNIPNSVINIGDCIFSGCI